MAMSRDFSGNDPNLFSSDDAFDTYIDMDFLRNNAMEEDVDFRNMSTSDLFRYYLEEELIKDTEVLDQPPPPTTYSAPPVQTVTNDFSLVTSPVPVTEDLKLTSVPVIEETNETAQQAIATTAVGPSLAILNAQLAELLAKLPTIKQEATSDKIANPTSPKSNVSQTLKSNNSNNNVQKSDDNNQIDMKKLSSKERRQIRNKISARNFRVRRKEYIQNLETTKEQQQEEINLLRQALLHLQEENTKLQQEVEELRKQKQQNTKSIVASPPSPPHISTSATTSKDNNDATSSLSKITSNNISRPNVNQIKGVPSVPPHQPSSPSSRYLVIPNVNKDASPSSSSTNQKTWQDSRVRVQTTFIPEFYLDKHLFKEKSTFPYSDFNNYPYRSMINLIEFSQSMDGQRFWLAYMLISTVMQQMTNLFIETVCATPKNQMISALFPNARTSVFEHANETNETNETRLQSFEVVNEEKGSEENLQSSLEAEQLNSEVEVPETSLLDSNTMVESVKEASVLDWLYDAMVKHVVEQSQMEAKIAELSDWVGEEWDDNVLPFLF